MMRVTADINGYPVARMFIHNTARQDESGRYIYDAALWDADSGTGWFGIEGVRHYRSDPWFVLVAAVSREVRGSREVSR